MGDIIKQIIDKISSYNIFNNLYPGIIFCYLLKIMFKINILVDNWFENLIMHMYTMCYLYYSCMQDETNMYVKQIKAETMEEMDPIRCSKYVQSNPGFTYKEAKKYLDEGREVLYSRAQSELKAKRLFGENAIVANDLMTVTL